MSEHHHAIRSASTKYILSTHATFGKADIKSDIISFSIDDHLFNMHQSNILFNI